MAKWRENCRKIIKASYKAEGKEITDDEVDIYIEKAKYDLLNKMIDQKGETYKQQRQEKQKEIYEAELIQNSKLSDRQKQELQETGSINVGGFFQDVKLERADVLVLLGMGLNPNDIKVGLFSNKIKIGKKKFISTSFNFFCKIPKY
jgi:Trk K+ transport system NAD-binding subunit